MSALAGSSPRCGALLLGLGLALACSDQPASGQGGGGTTGDAGAPAAGDAATLLPPVSIPDPYVPLGPSPTKCSGTPAPDAAIVRACVLAGSCSPFPAPASLSDCITQALPRSGLYPECVLGAQSCLEMDACVGSGFFADPCPDAEAQTHCVGSKAVYCGIPRYYHDCAKLGAECTDYSAHDDGRIDAADCSVVPACTNASDVYVCSGTKRVRCQHGIGFGEDCAAQGMVCVAGPEGAVCAKRPVDCNQPAQGSCDALGDGSYCGSDGRVLSLACSQLGFSCREAQTSALGVECGDAACPAADAAQCFEECDGSMAHLCLGGERFSIDCRTYGLRGCLLQTGSDGGDRARCGYD